MKERDLKSEAVEALRDILKEVSFVDLLENEEDRDSLRNPADWQGRLRLPDREIWLLLEAKNVGEPRIARNAVNQLLRHQASLSDSYGIFAAPWISPAAAQICKEAGIGYIDMAGNCRLTFGTVHVERVGNPNPRAEKRDLRSLYSPKASRILRVLLHAPRRPWKLQALADEARVSLGQVHKVKSLLADKEWLRPDTEGLLLSKPAELLAEWARNHGYRRNRIHEYYSLRPLGDTEAAIAETCKTLSARYALAAFSAAARLAPYVRYQRAQAYVQEDALPGVAQALDLKEGSFGANVALWVPYDEGVWYGAAEFHNVRVTSAVQTYLDLSGMHGRAEDAAGLLLKEVIEPTW